MGLLSGIVPTLSSAEVQEVHCLVPNQSIASIGASFVWSAADLTLLLLQERTHHLGNRQEVDRLSSLGSGSEFDVPLLYQLSNSSRPAGVGSGNLPLACFSTKRCLVLVSGLWK